MASTRHKNLAGSYAQEKRELALSVDYKTNKNICMGKSHQIKY